MKLTYRLLFHDREQARAAEECLREQGHVTIREEEDGHHRFYLLTLATIDNPLMPLEVDKLARAHNGEFQGMDTDVSSSGSFRTVDRHR